ncbi:MAG: TetR/AcrR family transcriptional regulator [Acidimicrobiales bacterium]
MTEADRPDPEFSTARRTRSRRGEGDRLREEILEATEALLVETGDAERVSIRAVADAVGVTPPSIYLHFADKAELLLTVGEGRFAEFDALLQQAATSVDDPMQALRQKGRAYVHFGVEHPEHYRILFMVRGAGDRTLDEMPAAAAAFGHLVDDVQRCMDAGVFAAGDATLVAVGLWTNMHGLTSLLICAPAFPWPEIDVIIDHVIDVAARGLAPLLA